MNETFNPREKICDPSCVFNSFCDIKKMKKIESKYGKTREDFYNSEKKFFKLKTYITKTNINCEKV